MTKQEELLQSLSPEEREVALKILNGISSKNDYTQYNKLKYSDYDEIPVDIETFLTDDNYLGKAWKDAYGKSKLYPFWLNELKVLFPNNTDVNYDTFLETGCRGSGKSEIACGAIMPYLMYRVLCLKNPLEYYHIKLTEKIDFAFMNIKLELAEKIATDKFQNTIQMSPWFMSKGTMTKRNNKPYWVPPDPVEIIIGSQSSDVIGRPIFCAFFDEISFLKNKDVEIQKINAKDMIDTAKGGMKTRFIHNGKNPTLLIVASSKRSEQSFMETYIRDLSETGNDKIRVVDKAVWVVKPKGTYSDETFYVGLGNKYLDNIVIPREEYNDLDYYKKKGYQLLEIPIDFESDAKIGLERILCDYAGISSFSANKFMSAERVNDVVHNELKNPLPDIITCGNDFKDTSQYKDWFDMSAINKQYISKPMFIHLDMSISGDKTGIAGVWIIGKKPTSDGNPGKDLMYQVAFSTSIKAPKGRQISFEKNRNFIRWLKQQGFNIRCITSDTFQSADLQQQLSAEGFDCKILSVDRVDVSAGEKQGVCKPYQYLKNTIYEKRINLYPTDLLYTELTQLEINNTNGKVDHPENGKRGCFTGDTRVSLTDGRELTMLELVNEFNNGKENYVYSFNESKKIIEPKLIENAWCTIHNADLVEVTLDNNEKIRCTSNHRFMLRDGNYKEAKDLVKDDSLMTISSYCISISSVKYIEDKEDVYDLTIRDNHNFALSNGIFVHNSKDQSDALCLHGCTKIYTLDGKNYSIEDLYKLNQSNELNHWVLAYDIDTQNFKPIKIQDVVCNGYKDNLIKLTLDNGESLICTDDHLILTRTGNYVEAKNTLNVSLMPFNCIEKTMYSDRDYPYVYVPKNDLTNDGVYLHKLVAESCHINEKLNKQNLKQPKEWIVIHHKDCNRNNNTPDNLEYLTNIEHSIIHAEMNSSEKKREQLRIANQKRLLSGTHPFQLMSIEKRRELCHNSSVSLNKSEKHRKAVSENNKLLYKEGRLSFQLHPEAAHTEEANKKREETCELRYNGFGFKSDIIQQKCRESCLKNNGYDNPFHSKEKQEEMRDNKVINQLLKIYKYLHLDISECVSLMRIKLASYALHINIESDCSRFKKLGFNVDSSDFNIKEYKKLQNKGNCVRKFIKETNKINFTYEEFSEYYEKKCSDVNEIGVSNSFRHRFRDKPSYQDILDLGFNIYNHRVVKIEKVEGALVYDLKLPDIHNFALTCGIIVHNCGAVYTASQHADEFAFDYGENAELLLSANSKEDLDLAASINREFEQELMKLGPKFERKDDDENNVYLKYDDIIVY